MNRTASTRAFALNPCPADPLGRQMVYMHMSSHYRRMYSAQSVVDSAAPSKRRAPRTGAGGGVGGGATLIGGGHTHPQNFSSAVPTRKQGVNVKNNARNTRVNTSDTGRNVRSRQSMREDVGCAGGKQAPRLKLRDRPGTYLAKLNQLAKGPINFGPIPKGEGSPAFKPRILSSNVQSKLRNSPVYHPPRPRATNRLKLEEKGKDNNHHTETPRSKIQSSPPGSSRDSAYNGGVSSSGESHLKARELALIQQKRRVWTSGHQKSANSEDLLPLGSPEGTIGDGGRIGSPTYSYFSSIVSSRGGTSDVGTNVDNRDHSGSFNEDIESQIEEDIPQEGASVFGDESRYGDPDEDGHVEVASHTEASCETFEEDEDSRSQVVDVLGGITPRTKPVDQMIQVEDNLGSAKSLVKSSANATTSTGSLQRVASACTSVTTVHEVKPRGAKSVGTLTADKYDEDFTTDKLRWPDTAYVRLVHAFTNDAVQRGVLTNKALRAIFQEHVAANRDTLDMDRMLEEWDKFRINLDIPKEEHELTANYGLGKTKWNRADYLDPLLSEPSEVWDETIGTLLPRPTVFLPHSNPTADVATNTSRPFDKSEINFRLKRLESDLREVYDPFGIMGSLGLPFENRNNTTISPYTVTNPVPKGVEKASSPFSEPVYRQPSEDLKCVCGESVCVCTSNDKIQGYMDRWQNSPEKQADVAPRRHSFPETRKTSAGVMKNLRPSSPVEGTQVTSSVTLVPPKSAHMQEKTEVFVLPEREQMQEKKTVRISADLNKSKVREKMIVCLFDQQHAFSSNDSVNEGIFGRNESGVGSITSPDIDISIPDNTLRSSPVTGANAFSQRADFSLSLISSTLPPNSDEPFKLLEQQDVFKWLDASPTAPTAGCE